MAKSSSSSSSKPSTATKSVVVEKAASASVKYKKEKKLKKHTKNAQVEVSTDIIKKHVTEIDELFGAIKTTKQEVKAKKEAADLKKKKELKKKKREAAAAAAAEDEDDATIGLIDGKFPKITNPEAPIHRWDAESGLPVYKAALLKVGDGGGTPLCPFDCNCCF